MSDTSTLAEQFASNAEFYRAYAGNFEPGSLGYLGNMAEATKYARMAEQFRHMPQGGNRG